VNAVDVQVTQAQLTQILQVTQVIKSGVGCTTIYAPGSEPADSVIVSPLPSAGYVYAIDSLGILQFTAKTSTDVVAWHWDFGDGETSTDENPRHRFVATGTYNVTLTVTSNGGCINTITKTIKVVTVTDLKANFDVDDAVQCIGTNLFRFNNRSSITTEGFQISKYAWDFGDGQIDSTKNTTHTYDTVGTFLVKLVITESPGRSTDSVTHTVKVVGKPIITDGAAPPAVCDGDMLTISQPAIDWRGNTPVTGTWMLDSVVFNPYTSYVTVADSGKTLRYRVDSFCGDTVSAGVKISVNPKLIIEEPVLAVCSGSTLTYDLSTALRFRLHVDWQTGDTLEYFPDYDDSDVRFSWTRDYHPGIVEAPAAGTNELINEPLTLKGTAPLKVTYRITINNGGCDNHPQPIQVTVNPNPTVFVHEDTVTVGDSVHFVATGRAPYTYDYDVTRRHDGAADSTTLTFVGTGDVTALTLDDIAPTTSLVGTYTFRLIGITDANGCYTTGLADTLTVLSKDLSAGEIEIEPVGPFTYTGSAFEPPLTVTYRAYTLEVPEDYTVTYVDNVNAGIAAYILTGYGNYSGTLSGAFVIEKAPGTFTPLTIPVEYVAGMTTGDVPLPEGYFWNPPTARVIPKVENEEFPAVYDSGDPNYLPAEGVVTLAVWINAKLKDLTADGLLTPAFSPETVEYALVLSCSNTLRITTVPSSGGYVHYALDGVPTAVPITFDNPGVATLILYSVGADSITTIEYRFSIVVQYNSDIIRPYWNDVLAVNLNTVTNGGFVFTKYEWVKDGVLLAEHGDNQPYLYQPAEGWYSAYLTTDTGQRLSVCPFFYDGQTHVTTLMVYPNPANISATVINPEWETARTMELYNTIGVMVRQYTCGSLETTIDLWGLRTGWYVLKVGKQSINLVIN